MMTGMLAIALAVAIQAAPMSEADKDAYNKEAAELATRWRAATDCRERPRLPDETVEACTDRRLAALSAGGNRAFYQTSPFAAGEARQRCDDGDQRSGEAPGACITRMMIVIQDETNPFGTFETGFNSPVEEVADRMAPRPRQERPAPQTTRCDRNVRNYADENETSMSISFGCSTGDADAIELLGSPWNDE